MLAVRGYTRFPSTYLISVHQCKGLQFKPTGGDKVTKLISVDSSDNDTDPPSLNLT